MNPTSYQNLKLTVGHAKPGQTVVDTLLLGELGPGV